MGASRDRTLSPDEARTTYNRIGRLQDWQSFYEAAPIRDVIDHGSFEVAAAVYELGSGTGAFARELLEAHLPPDARYVATDISERMIELSTRRLARWSDRCTLELVDGTLPLPGDDHRFDRFVANYVFDLFDEPYTEGILAEARRLLTTDGLLCAVSLTSGSTRVARAVCGSWNRLWSRAPALLGGCRPIDLGSLLGDQWAIVHQRTLVTWGVPSEVIVATPRGRPSPRRAE
jgi:SAM-dependent methyltransferase